MLIFNREGELQKTWGDGLFPDAHSIDLDREGYLWLTDRDAHMVYKYTRDGKQLMTLGKKGVAGDNKSTDAFNGPADVAVAANGDIFVADGHFNSRIVHFSKDGTFINIIGGTKGPGPGQLDVPHALVIDSKGRLIVADEQPAAHNARIQIFDQNGKFIEQWTNIGLEQPTAPKGRSSGMNPGGIRTLETAQTAAPRVSRALRLLPSRALSSRPTEASLRYIAEQSSPLHAECLISGEAEH